MVKNFSILEKLQSIYERAMGHHRDALYKPDSSHILAHLAETHPEATDSRKYFRTEVIRKYRSPTEREIHEALMIMKSKVPLLNNVNVSSHSCSWRTINVIKYLKMTNWRHASLLKERLHL